MDDRRLVIDKALVIPLIKYKTFMLVTY